MRKLGSEDRPSGWAGSRPVLPSQPHHETQSTLCAAGQGFQGAEFNPSPCSDHLSSLVPPCLGGSHHPLLLGCCLHLFPKLQLSIIKKSVANTFEKLSGNAFPCISSSMSCSASLHEAESQRSDSLGGKGSRVFYPGGTPPSWWSLVPFLQIPFSTEKRS